MTITLRKAKPIFLKFISNKTLSDKEQDSLNQIKITYADYLSDMLVPDDEDPIYYIYIGYCGELIDSIGDSESAEDAYDFILELAEACTDQRLATHFHRASDEAFGLFNSYKIDEFYDTIVESYEENRFEVIERNRVLLTKKNKESPNNIHVCAQNNILLLLISKWELSDHAESTSLAEHATKVLDMSHRISELLEYPDLSNTLHQEIQIIWRTWFIGTYVTEFFVPKLDETFKTESTEEIKSLLEVDEEQQTTFLELILQLLIKCVDTCIPTSCNDTQNNTSSSVANKKTRPSQGFIFRNIGNIELLEINVQFIFEVLKHTTDSHLSLLDKLEYVLQEFVAFASREWFIKSHHTLHHFATHYIPEDNNDDRNAILQTYIQMIQFLEHCYYKKTNGESIPITLGKKNTEASDALEFKDSRLRPRLT